MEKQAIKELVAREVNNGKSLSEIQKILSDEYDEKITFLDLRVLASELEDVQWDQKEENAADDDRDEQEQEEEQTPDQGTVVEVSKLVRPGAVASGTVKFASGASAEWILNHSGQLGLDKVVGTPTESDIQEFQVELQKAFSQGR